MSVFNKAEWMKTQYLLKGYQDYRRAFPSEKDDKRWDFKQMLWNCASILNYHNTTTLGLDGEMQTPQAQSIKNILQIMDIFEATDIANEQDLKHIQQATDAVSKEMFKGSEKEKVFFLARNKGIYIRNELTAEFDRYHSSKIPILCVNPLSPQTALDQAKDKSYTYFYSPKSNKYEEKTVSDVKGDIAAVVNTYMEPNAVDNLHALEKCMNAYKLNNIAVEIRDLAFELRVSKKMKNRDLDLNKINQWLDRIIAMIERHETGNQSIEIPERPIDIVGPSKRSIEINIDR